MICRNCGQNNTDSARFCQTCGESLGNDLGFAEIPSGTAVTAAIKRVAGSGTFLFATLLFTAVIVLKVLAALQGVTPYVEQFEELAAQYGSQYGEQIQAYTGYTIDEMLNLFASAAMPTIPKAIAMQAGTIIFALCLWMIYASGKSKGVSTVGISIIKVLMIIRFVFVIIGNLLCIGGLALLTVGLYQQDVEGYVMAAIATAILLITFIFVIIYNAKLIGSLTAAKMAMYGDPTGKFSGFVAFILIASAIINLIASGISSITVFNAYSLAAAIMSALATLLYGLMIGKARNAVRAAR